MKASLPYIHSHPFSFEELNWTAFYLEDCQEFLGEPVLAKALGKLLKGKKLTVLCRQVHIETIPFLVSIHYNRKEVYLLSCRAHREYFLKDRLKEEDLDKEGVLRYRELGNFLEKAFQGKAPQFGQQLEATVSLPELPHCLEETDRLRFFLEKEIEAYRRGFLEGLSDYGLKLSAQHSLIRVHLLKFVALFSSLDFKSSGLEVKELLLESLRRFLAGTKERGKEGGGVPWFLTAAFRLVFFLARLLPSLILVPITQWCIEKMARRFIAGENLPSARPSLLKLFHSGRDATLDQLGELVLSSEEADEYRDHILSLIDSYRELITPREKNRAGILKAHISIKVSALCQDLNPCAFDYSYQQVAPRLREILHRAKKAEVFINIDAEHYPLRDAVFAIYQKLLLEDDFLKDYQQTGIVVQAYLRDAPKHLREVIELAKRRGLVMPVRLVKGAYWDAETVEAHAHSYDPPQFINKEETDTIYQKLMVVILKNHSHVQLCLGGHNLSDHCYGEAVREKYFPKAPPIEHQCLHMTYEALSLGMAKCGWVVRNYVPIGPLLVGISYLVRRIMENCSQAGVLFQSRTEKVAKPREAQGDRSVMRRGDYFFNMPFVRLFIKEEREAVQRGLEQFSQELGKPYDREGERKGERVSITSSSDPSCTVGTIRFSKEEDVREAIDRSLRAFGERGGWAETLPAIRGSYLLTAAQRLLLKRVELACLICFEAGKTFPEALGDVDEAVDFLNFYARAPLAPHSFARGVVVAVSPWNFPLAIPCGMVGAALMAGNTVLLKSAEQTPLVAQCLVDIFHWAGIPRDVLIHLPGPGETVGASLLESEEVAQVVFTGSLEVGRMISQKCGGRPYRHPRLNRFYPVKVVAEMGGKNAIIITASSDLDEAVSGALESCYGHAGQKCSACSRILVDEKIVNRFLFRFVSASRDIPVGEASNFQTKINPLISQEERERLFSLESDLLQEAKDFGGVVHLNRLRGEYPGNCVGPLIIELPSHRVRAEDSFLQRELFAPVVHIVSYKDKKEALELFNATNYALTGGLYSESQDEIDFFTAAMECGNIYVNRSCTGARVGAEPFGGFKLSGTGPKAGGVDYVKAFMVTDSLEGEVQAPSEKNYPLPVSRHPRFFQLSQVLKEYLRWAGAEMAQKDRTLLWDFYHWMKKGCQRWDRPNHPIAGQLSYTDFALPKKEVLVASQKALGPWVLLGVFGALGAGSRVRVICDSKEVRSSWQRVLFYAGYLSPLIEYNLSVEMISSRDWDKVLSSSESEVCLLDAEREDYPELFSSLKKGGNGAKCMRRNLIPWDTPSLGDFESYVTQFTEPRSFAVNMIRYGAPLE